MSKDQKKYEPDWMSFKGEGALPHDVERWPDAPPWRKFEEGRPERGSTYKTTPEQVWLVNAALCLRRPLLVTGKPGVGKSSLAYAVAEELKLGPVLHWPITSRSTLDDGLYSYDAIGRLQETKPGEGDAPKIEDYLTLGPLGTAMAPADKPRVLLIDEIDKSDIDLPNDLLNIFEEGVFRIPELARHPVTSVSIRKDQGKDDNDTVSIDKGWVRCKQFPFVVMTSNDERDFPPPFLRRCLRLHIEPPKKAELEKIVENHLRKYFGEDKNWRGEMDKLIEEFLKARDERHELLANDQLLNAVFLLARDTAPHSGTKEELIKSLLYPLDKGVNIDKSQNR